MTHTRYYDDHRVVLPGRVAAYDAGADGRFLVDWSTQFDTVGAGGLVSSVDDMLLWDRNFYENKLGKGTLRQELETRGLLNNGREISYALGLVVAPYRGLPTVEHNGALYGYRTAILRFPEQHFSVVCLCNVSNVSTGSLSHQVADVYLEKSFKKETGASGSPEYSGGPDASRFAGKYLDARNEMVYSFTASGGHLVAWGAGLRRVGPNQFMDLGSGLITFTEAGAGMKAALVMDGADFFSGMRMAQPHLSEAELSGYAASYKSGELDATYVLSLKNGNLTLRNGWEPEVTLTPLTEEEFLGEEMGTLVFHRDAKHQVNGFRVYSGAVRDVGFDKVM
jgi:Beta-lactamase